MDAGISGLVGMDGVVGPASGPEGQQPDNAKTRQATRYGVRLFREYCEQHGVEAINALAPREIARMLRGFYGQARTKDGQRFSVNSLIAIRYAISRYYRSPMVHRKVDIVKDVAFNDANETFRAVLKDLEREARGSPACHRELQMVDMDDRRKLRHYFEHAIGTPRGLLQKVWYDLMLRVGRRGRESQRLLNRNSFRIAKTPDGRQYIYQVDDEEAGIIVEIPGDPLCPVKTLKLYLGRLNPACRALFQRPKEHVYEQDSCWYVNSPVGKNMLATMMSTISKCARLSRIYTNVRIRATTYSPADGKGCIPCTDTSPAPAEQMETSEQKPQEPSAKGDKKPDLAPKPQNSHIIKQLNAPIVQACLSVAVSNSTASSPVISRVFPVALSSMQKTELLNGQTLTIKSEKESQCRQCDWCKKELSSGSMVLKSSEAGKEYCSTECLGKWLASEHRQAENGTPDSAAPASPSNPKIQKLLTLCSSANLLIPFPSICKDFTAAASEEEAIENGGTTKAESRSSSPQLIVPDEVYSETAMDSDLESSASPGEEEFSEKSTCDQEVMCSPSMTSLAISCKPILKNQAVQTDFSTYFEESLFGRVMAPSFPRYIVNSFCCGKDETPDDSDVVEEHSVLHDGNLVCFDDAQDTHSLWMSVEECDEEGEAVEFLPPVEMAKCEEALISEPLAAVYSHRGRTTKRTTWDEIAQRSKLQTLWGVKVFREWLQARGSRKDFERLEGAPLADILEEFYEHLTKPDGEEYSVSTMHTIRASISRYLSLPPQSKPFSIIRDREFKRANEAFYRRIRRLQTPRQQQPQPQPPQPFQYGVPPSGGAAALWRPPPGTLGIPCNSNGIMLVRLGPQ